MAIINKSKQNKTKNKKINNNYWQGCGEKNIPCVLLSGNVTWYRHYRKQYGGSQKIKNETTTI